jgi:hypothetical protein
MKHDFPPHKTGQRIRCRRQECGLELFANAEVDLENVYPECGPQAKAELGLGDRLARLLQYFGIKTCGGCSKRKAWLNKFGAKAATIWKVKRR